MYLIIYNNNNIMKCIKVGQNNPSDHLVILIMNPTCDELESDS